MGSLVFYLALFIYHCIVNVFSCNQFFSKTLFRLYNIPFYGYTIIYIIKLLLLGISDISSFSIIRISLYIHISLILYSFLLVAFWK